MTARFLGPTCTVSVHVYLPHRQASLLGQGWRPSTSAALRGARPVKVCPVCVSSSVPELPLCAFLLLRGLRGKTQGMSCPSHPLGLQRGSDPSTSDGHARLRDHRPEQSAQTCGLGRRCPQWPLSPLQTTPGPRETGVLSSAASVCPFG